MRYQADTAFFLECFREIVNTPSPSGYYTKLNPVLEEYAALFGEKITYDNKSTAYITLQGEDTSKTVLIGAHADTIGMVVRSVEPNGLLRVRRLGGVNFASMEGETVTVHTRDGREYTGLLACKSHSVHVFDDAKTLERNEDNMVIFLDEQVSNASDVRALGIRNGDFVSADPGFRFTSKGFIKSRYIDDKAAIACAFTMLKYLKDYGLRPKYNTILAFPYGEELGLGGTYVPAEVSEYIALDIGLVAPGYEGSEYAVSICAKDNTAPYDYDLTNRLISLAEEADCEYAVDVFYRYSTDANAAMRAGNNLRAAAFGMAVICSHGMERTHIEGIENTVGLLLAYVLNG